MSAENAWRIAMEAASERCWTIDDCFRSLPMPPAFRAEVEAEAEELRGMLAELIGEVLEHCDDRQDVNWEGDGPNAEMRLGNVAREMRAVARAALGEPQAQGCPKWGPDFPPSCCTAWEDCVSDGMCHDPNCGAPSQHSSEDSPND